MTISNQSQLFTLEIDGQAVVVFDAESSEQAAGICALPEFKDDLSNLTADGKSIYKAHQMLRTRPATIPEAEGYAQAIARSGRSDAMTMIFLIRVDGVLVTVVDPD